jgi:hypothetical protein
MPDLMTRLPRRLRRTERRHAFATSHATIEIHPRGATISWQALSSLGVLAAGVAHEINNSSI